MIIGLTGPAFAGKDTVGNYLQDMHDFEIKAFADPIRAALVAMFGLTQSDFAPERKEHPIDWLDKSPRQLMQTLGTEWGRTHVAADIWCRSMAQRLIIAQRFHQEDFVLTDVRFQEEADMVHRLGGFVWRIERPNAATTQHAGHASETAGAAIKPDRILINDGTIDDLYEKVDAALEKLVAA